MIIFVSTYEDKVNNINQETKIKNEKSFIDNKKNNVQGLDIKKAVTEPITALHNASRASFTN